MLRPWEHRPAKLAVVGTVRAGRACLTQGDILARLTSAAAKPGENAARPTFSAASPTRSGKPWPGGGALPRSCSRRCP